jgi:hypothetical protein
MHRKLTTIFLCFAFGFQILIFLRYSQLCLIEFTLP